MCYGRDVVSRLPAASSSAGVQLQESSPATKPVAGSTRLIAPVCTGKATDIGGEEMQINDIVVLFRPVCEGDDKC